MKSTYLISMENIQWNILILVRGLFLYFICGHWTQDVIRKHFRVYISNIWQYLHFYLSDYLCSRR